VAARQTWLTGGEPGKFSLAGQAHRVPASSHLLDRIIGSLVVIIG